MQKPGIKSDALPFRGATRILQGQGFCGRNWTELDMKMLDFELRHLGQSHDMSTFSYVFKAVKQ